jgi:hypothetical protein
MNAPLPVIVAATAMDVELASQALHAPLREAVLELEAKI